MKATIRYFTDKEPEYEVQLDKQDTWSADHTLSVIILPVLKQLKATKQGAPFVDDEDVPDELKSTSAPPKENEWDIDANHFKRWDWAMDEMIWAMDQIANHCPEEDVLYNLYKTGSINCDEWIVQARGASDRIRRGTTLFGKYYQSLWD